MPYDFHLCDQRKKTFVKMISQNFKENYMDYGCGGIDEKEFAPANFERSRKHWPEETHAHNKTNKKNSLSDMLMHDMLILNELITPHLAFEPLDIFAPAITKEKKNVVTDHDRNTTQCYRPMQLDRADRADIPDYEQSHFLRNWNQIA